MREHTGLEAHDGYVEHSHEVRPDHDGVTILNTPGAPRTVTREFSYLLLARRPGDPWQEVKGPDTDEDGVRHAYRLWRSQPYLQARLVRRLVVTTDEILEES